MLQTLTDFFLIISKDREKITNKDISIFYNFIIKKMPQYEQQYPSLILKSLNISSQNEDKISSEVNEHYNTEDSKKIFNHFQKQIINLFNDLIDYCYTESIIKLDDKFEKIIKAKIDDIINKPNYKKNTNINSKNNYNNYYQKELLIKKAKKDEFRNFLILLIINGDINFDIYPNHYINFFNSENKIKNRLNAEQFMKFIKYIIKIYKDNKKHSKKKIINKSNNNTEKKLNNIKGNSDNTNKNNKTDGKNNGTNGKNSSSGLNNFNIKNKATNLSSKNNKITFKQINKNMFKIFSNNFISVQSKDEIEEISINNYYLKNLEEKNEYDKKLTPASDKSSVINNDSSYDDDNKEFNDTIKCETPKNIKKETKFGKSERINLDRLFSESQQNKRRYSADKNTNKGNKRLTISSIPSKNENILNLKENISEYSPKKYYLQKNQNKNLINRNKNITINIEEKNSKCHKSLVDENSLNNYIIKKKILEDKNKPINKSQSTIGKDIFENEITNIKKIYKKKKNICGENKLIKEDINNKENELNDKYNLVSNIKKDKNNNEYKELYLYEDLEVHQHLVIFNEDNKENEEKDVEEDDIRCIIF